MSAHGGAQVQLVPIQKDEVKVVVSLSAPLAVKGIGHDHEAEPVRQTRHFEC